MIQMKQIATLIILLLSQIAAHACTSAIISADRTVNGRPLLWKHRDTSNANSRIAYIPAANDSDICFVALFNADDPGNRQAWIGMNAAGFAIMNTASYNILPKGIKSADREGLLMALALKRCRTVDDFALLLHSLPKPLGVEANFGVIDAFGNGAFFETGNDSYQRFNLSDSPNGILVRTNFSYSGREGEGSGHIRHQNAMNQLLPYAKTHSITPELLTEKLSRTFYRATEDKNFLNSDSVRIIADSDFIPRFTSVATVVIEGIAPSKSIPSAEFIGQQYIMWTGLGYPPCAEIRPVFCRPDGVEIGLMGCGPNNHAPLADTAQRKRLDVFSSKKRSGKTRFVDLDKLSNSQRQGYMQTIIPLNLETYRRYSSR